MKKNFLVILLILTACTVTLTAKQFKIVSTDWAPYEFKKGDQPAGLATDIVDLVLKEMGTDYTISFYPWKRAEAMVKDGNADAIFSISHKKAREEFLIYPKTDLHKSKYVFFIRKDDVGKLKYSSLDDLKGHKVGVTAGYSYNDKLWNFLKKNKNYMEAPSDLLNFKKLAGKRFDYFPSELAAGLELIKKNGMYDEITYIDNPVISKDYYIAFSKKSKFADMKAFTDKFNKALKKVKKGNKYQVILAKYLK